MSDILTMNKSIVDASGRPVHIPSVDEVKVEGQQVLAGVKLGLDATAKKYELQNQKGLQKPKQE